MLYDVYSVCLVCAGDPRGIRVNRSFNFTTWGFMYETKGTIRTESGEKFSFKASYMLGSEMLSEHAPYVGALIEKRDVLKSDQKISKHLQ